jgi:hypothetical protein
MKILVDEKDQEGFDALLGEIITVFCARGRRGRGRGRYEAKVIVL